MTWTTGATEKGGGKLFYPFVFSLVFFWGRVVFSKICRVSLRGWMTKKKKEGEKDTETFL